MPSRQCFNINTMSCDTQDCCSPERLREEIRNNGKVLILDCRSQSDYARCHIRPAINISLPSLMQKRLKRGNLNISSVIQNNEAKERFSRAYLTHQIVLYDECSTDLNANPSAVLALLVKKLRQDGCNVAFLIGRFTNHFISWS
jgi:dual specificity MAP kinase phosphatase